MQRMSKKFARGANLLFLEKVTVVRMHHGLKTTIVEIPCVLVNLNTWSCYR